MDEFILETERLYIIPFKLEALKLLLKNTKEFEKKYNVTYAGEELTGFIYNIFRDQTRLIEKYPSEHLFLTFWFFMLKDERKLIGSACFKGAPNKNGEVEIGYGIEDSFKNQGYTTEAVKKMIEWALKEEGVSSVIAETDKGNLASQRILLKCKMMFKNETKDSYWWTT